MKLASFRIVLSLLRAPPKQFCAFPVEITRRLFANLSNRSKPARVALPRLVCTSVYSSFLELNGGEKRLAISNDIFFLLIFKSTNAGVRDV